MGQVVVNCSQYLSLLKIEFLQGDRIRREYLQHTLSQLADMDAAAEFISNARHDHSMKFGGGSLLGVPPTRHQLIDQRANFSNSLFRHRRHTFPGIDRGVANRMAGHTAWLGTLRGRANREARIGRLHEL